MSGRISPCSSCNAAMVLKTSRSCLDTVKGDAGLEFFTTCGCLYQCYASEEVSNVKKAASAMKAKAGRDLPKLEKNKTIIEKLLAGTKIRRWKGGRLEQPPFPPARD